MAVRHMFLGQSHRIERSGMIESFEPVCSRERATKRMLKTWREKRIVSDRK